MFETSIVDEQSMYMRTAAVREPMLARLFPPLLKEKKMKLNLPGRGNGEP